MSPPFEVLHPVSSERGEVPAPADREPLTVLITRTVAPESAREFAGALEEITATLKRFPGFLGASVFRREEGAGVEFTIVQRFANEAAHARWMESADLQRWIARVTPLCRAEVVLRRYRGLDGLFAAGSVGAPPRWKMAFIVWLAIFPTALTLAMWATPRLTEMPLVPRTMLLSLVSVLLMTYVLLPLLTRLFAGWLRPR